MQNQFPQSDDLHGPNAEPEEFFDRERWHDVESEEEMSQESDEIFSRSSVSTFSIAILMLITVIAGGAGIIAAYLIPILFAPEFPIRSRNDYATTPPLWIGYAENGVFSCEINSPTCFAATLDGTIYIGDASPPSIQVFSLRGKHMQTIPLDAAPRALAVDRLTEDNERKKELTIATADRIDVYSGEGKIVRSWSLPEEHSEVWSVAVADGIVFAADSKNKVVYRFDEKEKTPGIIGKKPNAARNADSDKSVSVPETPNVFGGFVVLQSPICLTVSRKTGLLHVANPRLHRVETFTLDGHWEPSLSWTNASADITGFCGCCNPIGLDTLQDGRIVTSEKSITRVKVYRVNGRLDCIVAGPEVLGKKPLNIPRLQELPPAIEDEGKPVMIAATENDHIVVFDPLWRIVRLFIPTGTNVADRNGQP